MKKISIPIECRDTKSLVSILESSVLCEKINWKDFWANVNDEFSLLELVAKFQDKTDWYILSKNDKIRWDLNLIEEFKDKIIWEHFSSNSGIIFSSDLIDKYLNKWKWKGDYHVDINGSLVSTDCLSRNNGLPLTIDLINRYLDYWDWTALSLNTALIIDHVNPFDEYELNQIYEENINILIYFKNKWSFSRSTYLDDNYFVEIVNKDSIFNNPSINWKREELRIAFIEEIENYNRLYNDNI